MDGRTYMARVVSIGAQDFEDLVMNDCFYVDKSRQDNGRNGKIKMQEEYYGKKKCKRIHPEK